MHCFDNCNHYVSSKPSLLNDFQQKALKKQFPELVFKFQLMPHFFSVNSNDGVFLGNVFIEMEYDDGWVRKFSIDEMIESIEYLSDLNDKRR